MQMPSERNSVIMNAVPLEKSMAPLVPRKVEMLHKQCHAYHFIVVVLGEETLKMILKLLYVTLSHLSYFLSQFRTTI